MPEIQKEEIGNIIAIRIEIGPFNEVVVQTVLIGNMVGSQVTQK
jgi:hypothetical protein